MNNTTPSNRQGEVEEEASQNTILTGLTLVGASMNETPSISKVVDGTNNLNLESNKNIEGDDLTVLSGLTMDEPPNIQNNNGNQDEQNKENAHQDFQQGGAN
jgi:hypothetical protein